MKPRKITVDETEYRWNTYRPNGDGDGGIGLRVWEDRKIIIDLWLSGRSKPDAITPGFVAKHINYHLKPVEFIHAGGDCTCSCGKAYREHPYDGPFTETGGHQPYQWLHRICDGTLVKL